MSVQWPARRCRRRFCGCRRKNYRSESRVRSPRGQAHTQSARTPLGSSVRIGHAPNEINKAGQGSGRRSNRHRYPRLYQLATSVHRQHSRASRAYRAVSRSGGPREGARVHFANSERFGENEVETKFYNRNRTTSHPRGAASFSGRDGSHAARLAYRLRNRCSLVGGELTCVGFAGQQFEAGFLMHDFASERIYEANVAIHVCTDKWMRVVAESQLLDVRSTEHQVRWRRPCRRVSHNLRAH